MSDNENRPSIPGPADDSSESIELVRNARKEVEERLEENIFYGLQSLMDSADSYKQLARRTSHFLHYAVLISVLAIACAIVGFSRDIQMRYFVQDPAGRWYETDATKRPRIDEKALLTFASDIAIGFHTFNYTNYTEKFREMKEFCKPDVVKSVFLKMDESEVFTTLRDRKQFYTATPVSMIVHREIPSDNPNQWQIKGIVNEVILSPGGKDVIEDFEILIDIEKVPLSESPRGMLCTRIIENYAK